MATVRALIVGCGNIGGRFDFARAPALPLTHAGAYQRDGRFQLDACVEPDDVRRDEFMRAWRIPAGFRSLEEATDLTDNLDVISICSPTASHATNLEAALALRPRIIFCEKPVSTTLPQAESLVASCARARVPLAVNYTRRWDPDVADLKRGVDEGRWGPLRAVTGHYNKGLLNNGSHMLDLLHFLLGPLRVVHAGRPIPDFFPDDPSIPVWMETAVGLTVQLGCAHAADYAFFELQLVFAQTVITMEEGGLFWRERPATDSAEFAGYRVPGDGARRPGSYAQAMLRSVDNIFGAVTRAQPLASTGESALAAQRLCEEIRNR